MTPVLWAAFEGKLDAMKLLIGRGGDPDKTDQFGNSALHLGIKFKKNLIMIFNKF
jgi:ankyrin repeat protein